MNNAISEAETQTGREKRTLERQHSDDLDQLEREYNQDIAAIDVECREANSTAWQEREAAKGQVNSRYTTSYNERYFKYEDDRYDIIDDAYDRAKHASTPEEADQILDAMVSEVDALTNSAASDLNAMDYPTEYRLYAEAPISEVFSLGVDLVSMFGSLEVSPVAVRFKPNLRTLTGGDFSRFDEYYQDTTGPSGA
jgi:hypothetical protein